MAGIVKRYKTTIKSPLKPAKGKPAVTPNIVATKTTLNSPKKGENKKTFFDDPLGMIISLPNNFMISMKF